MASATCHRAVITDVHNLLRYARFHLGDASVASQPVITAASVAAMKQPQVTVFEPGKWGLSWGLDRVGNVDLVQHSGGTTGQITRLVLVPARNFAVAVFTNAQQGGATATAIVNRALELYCGVKRPEPVAEVTSGDALRPYTGIYRNAFSEVELGLLAGRLIGQIVEKGGFPTQDSPPAPPPPPVTLGMVSADRLVGLDGGFKNVLVDVVRLPDEAIGWLRINGRLYRRQA